MTSVQLYAPIALFAYARPAHLRLTLDSLRANPEAVRTPLVVYCDGPRQPDDLPQTNAVRALVDSIDGFHSVTRIYRDNNLGLAQSIITGVTALLSEYDAVIVMEDDLFVSPHFLHYMNAGLLRYRDVERVASVHGYSYPVSQPLPETFFLRGADCWGWATWARAWRHFEPDGQKLLTRLRSAHLTRAFDLDGAYPYTRMLAHQIAGKNNSWAVRWHAACFLENMLTLYPGRSLVNNIGMDDSGTHCTTTDDFSQVVASRPVQVDAIPIEQDLAARKHVAQFMGRHSAMNARARRFARRLLGMVKRKLQLQTD